MLAKLAEIEEINLQKQALIDDTRAKYTACRESLFKSVLLWRKSDWEDALVVDRQDEEMAALDTEWNDVKEKGLNRVSLFLDNLWLYYWDLTKSNYRSRTQLIRHWSTPKLTKQFQIFCSSKREDDSEDSARHVWWRVRSGWNQIAIVCRGTWPRRQADDREVEEPCNMPYANQCTNALIRYDV